MAGPLVSVVMPFHNGERHMAEAIESVLAQSYPAWELLLVDDRSSDGSPAIARAFAEPDSRIRLLTPHPGHSGAAAARNAGIDAAHGDYVAFLDADDLYAPGKLAFDIAALEEHPDAAWVYGATRWFFEGGAKRDYHERLGVPLDRTYAPPLILNRVILRELGDVPCTCGVMIRKRSLDAVGGFEERFALYEDQSLWVKLLLDHPVRVISGCNAAYRQHAASTSSAAAASGDYQRSAAHPARDAFLAWIGAYAAERNAAPSVAKALAQAKRANDGSIRSRIARRLRGIARRIGLI